MNRFLNKAIFALALLLVGTGMAHADAVVAVGHGAGMQG